MVHQPISQSLPVQPLFLARNVCVPRIWVFQIVPPALSSALLMWNKHLQEVIMELVTTLNELPPKKQARVLTKVQQKLATGN